MAGSSALVYQTEHEMGAMPSGVHQLGQNLPYFGHANPGPSSIFPPSCSHGNGLKGISNGRRSPPLPPHLANGMTNSKSNGGWMNPHMGMGSFQIGSSNGKGDRDPRTVQDDDEQDRLVTRDRDRKRAEPDNVERRDYWEKESDPDRDRTRDLSYIHSTPIPYGHGSGAPTPGPGVDGHHHSPHHHRNHHHHVLHRHGPPHAPSSLPSPMHPGSGGAPPIVHSPRSTRDYDMPGSSSRLHGFERLPGGQYMVVMDDVSNDYISLFNFIQDNPDLLLKGNEGTRNLFLQTVRDGLIQLHQAGLVHGDVRNTNIMVKTIGLDDLSFLLVDYDSGGKIRQVRYPLDLNASTVKRPEGATGGAIVEVEHDLEMLNYIWDDCFL